MKTNNLTNKQITDTAFIPNTTAQLTTETDTYIDLNGNGNNTDDPVNQDADYIAALLRNRETVYIDLNIEIAEDLNFAAKTNESPQSDSNATSAIKEKISKRIDQFHKSLTQKNQGLYQQTTVQLKNVQQQLQQMIKN